MNSKDFEKLVQYIISESIKLKNKYTDEIDAKVEFCDIFSRNTNEYKKLTKINSKLGIIVFHGPTGNIYKLKTPIKTKAGNLYLLKIRKPDKNLKLRGDADFSTNYTKLKQKHQNDQHFEHIVREKFEMLRLSDPSFKVMSCFSNIPVRDWI